jgi:hypothetical protein
MQQIKETATAETKKVDAVKDAGLVRLGAGNINFADPIPAHKATKDAGRVRMGAGNIQF